jgi:hypothetical protein
MCNEHSQKESKDELQQGACGMQEEQRKESKLLAVSVGSICTLQAESCALRLSPSCICSAMLRSLMPASVSRQVA